MKAQYRFRDTNGNVSVVSIWLAASYTPIDFAQALSMGVLISNISDAQLIGMTITYTEEVTTGVPGPQSNVNRLYLITCFLGTGDTCIVIVPSADTQYLAVDAQARTLPAIDPANPIMVDVQSLVDGLTDEYGTPIERAVLVGLAI